eukprot:scaffold723_cov370-Pinguiococcus_pyrenoidosus.AAC.1
MALAIDPAHHGGLVANRYSGAESLITGTSPIYEARQRHKDVFRCEANCNVRRHLSAKLVGE